MEQGYFVESFRDKDNLTCAGNRSASTAIYYLLPGAQSPDRWHVVPNAAEVWHWYAGAPLSLYITSNKKNPKTGKVDVEEILMGNDLLAGMKPQAVVPKGYVQQARSWGEYTLVGTTGEISFYFQFHFHVHCFN